MGLFKSSEERRIERDIKIRQGIRRIEKSIREQGKFSDEFIRNAQQAKRIGDTQQYNFIRNSLKKTAAIKRMLERQLLRPVFTHEMGSKGISGEIKKRSKPDFISITITN